MAERVVRTPTAGKPKLLDQRVKALLTRRGDHTVDALRFSGQYTMIGFTLATIKSATTIATTLGSKFIRDVAPRSLEADLLRSLSGAV